MKFFIRPKGYVSWKPVIVEADDEDQALDKVQQMQDSLVQEESEIMWEDTEIVRENEDLFTYYMSEK